MTPVGTLWGLESQRQTKVVLSVAALNELELKRPEFSFANRPVEFIDRFPYNKIPAFEGTDGFKLTEGTAIARYLSGIGTKVNLLGSNAVEAAIVDQWVHFAEYEIAIPNDANIYMVFGYIGPFNLEMLNKYFDRLVRALDHLESHLAARPSGYVALDTLTLADIVLAGVLFNAARVSLGSAERARFPHVFRHYAKVTADERVSKYWGTDLFTEVRITEPRAP